MLISLYVTLPPSQGRFVPKLRPGSPWTPERLLLQWTTPSITPVEFPVHYTTGQPCLQANYLFRPNHPRRMIRRPVTRMSRVTTLPPNVTCRRVTHPSADRARRCLTSERRRASQPHQWKASSLARLLISLYVTPQILAATEKKVLWFWSDMVRECSSWKE